jgi:CTP synthase (UTP-ammonia lyase)
VIGDRTPGFTPQESISTSLTHAADEAGVDIDVTWVPTPSLTHGEELNVFDGVWCAPGSPYLSLDGALAGIRFARESRTPFIGTCAGFQHGVLEFARNVLGLSTASHAEYGAGDGTELIIDELLCSLVGQTMHVRLVTEEARAWYGRGEVAEQYYCRFGLDESYVETLQAHGMLVAGVDASDGSTRILQLAPHPYFVLTLFVPQTRSEPGAPHPLIHAFVAAMAQESHAIASNE